MTTGERIKMMRVARHLTQEELGQAIGVQKSAIAKYESGRVVNLKRETIRDLAAALDVAPSWLLGMDDAVEPEISRELTREEDRLLECYRAADPRYQELALELLEEHPRR